MTSEPNRRGKASLTRHAIEAMLTARRGATKRVRGPRSRRRHGIALDLAVAATLMALAIVIFAARTLQAS